MALCLHIDRCLCIYLTFILESKQEPSIHKSEHALTDHNFNFMNICTVRFRRNELYTEINRIYIVGNFDGFSRNIYQLLANFENKMSLNSSNVSIIRCI